MVGICLFNINRLDGIAGNVVNRSLFNAINIKLVTILDALVTHGCGVALVIGECR